MTSSQPAPESRKHVFQPLKWDYRVVHINTEPGSPPPPPDPKTASQHLQGLLSPDFLAKEFPEVYGEEAESFRKIRHPAEQLQGFLNLLGREGWELTQTCQVGPLLMFFFKRPLPPHPSKPGIQRTENRDTSPQ